MVRRDLCFELARVTEAAALASAPWRGKGNKIAADGAAVDAMRTVLNTIDIKGEVVIGEGEKDKAPMLYIGEKVGSGFSREIDIAVDPVEGTSLVAKGLPNALAVIAAARKGNLLNAPDMYMKKIAVGPEARGTIDIEASPAENIQAVARAKGKSITDLTVVVLDRLRHEKLIKAIIKTGARVKLISDGDVAGGISTALEDTGIDLLMGIGGAPEGVLTAVALKCLGGDMQAQLYPRNEADITRAYRMGIEEIDRIFTIADLAKGDDIIFSATGITGGDFLNGVVYRKNRASTHSLIMNSYNKKILRINTLYCIDEIENDLYQIVK